MMTNDQNNCQLVFLSSAITTSRDNSNIKKYNIAIIFC